MLAIASCKASSVPDCVASLPKKKKLRLGGMVRLFNMLSRLRFLGAIGDVSISRALVIEVGLA